MYTEIEKHVRTFIAQSFLYQEELTFGDEESLLAQGVVDSMGVLELVTFLEDTFRIKVADEELLPDNLDSVRQLTAFVQRKLEAQNPGGIYAS